VFLTNREKEELSKQSHDHSNETMKAWYQLIGQTVDLVEVCTPWDSPLGKAVEEKGGKVFRMGVHNGFDLSTRKGFLSACRALRELRPMNFHASPHCYPWSQFQNLNQNNPKQCEDLEEKRNVGRKVLKAIERLAEIQFYELQVDVSGEQPWKASSWNERPWAALAKRAGGRFRVDGCRFGMKDPKTKLLMQKGWVFFATKLELKKALAKTCNHPPEAHIRIEGRLTAASAEYPRQLCTAFADAILNHDSAFQQLCFSLNETREVCEVFSDGPLNRVVVDDDDDDDNDRKSDGYSPTELAEDEPREDKDEGFDEPGKGEAREGDVDGLSAEDRGLLLKIHRNLGHPNSASLQKLLSQSGAPSKFVKAAGKLQCDVCIRQAQRKPVLPAAINTPKQKWEVISVDTFWWQNPKNDAEGNERHVVGLSFLDEASDLHVASVVREGKQLQGSITAEEFRVRFLKDWLKCLPKPKVLRVDTEGCFRSQELIKWCEERMIQVVPIAGEAYWQVGKHSRHLHTLKQTMTKLAQDLGNNVSSPEILALSVSAKNEMHQIRGYSPNQWAFGQNSDRVFSTLNCYEHLPNICSEDPTFHENIQRMSKAREMFLQADSHRKLARAALLKTRKTQTFEVGDLVYYYRKGRGKAAKQRGQWHGPARVLFMEKTTRDEKGYPGSIIWISHGVVLLRCAPEHLQHVSRDMSSVDQEINGPFSPDEFLKGKHVYQDLFGERSQIHDEATGEDDNAWLYDPNNMKFEKDESFETMEEGPIKRVRFQGKTRLQSEDLDRVVGKPSNVEPGSENREDQQGDWSRDRNRLQGHDLRRTGDDDTQDGQGSHRKDLPEPLGKRAEVLPMGGRTQEGRGSMGTTPLLPPDEDQRDGKSSGSTGHQDIQREGQGIYQPIRTTRHSDRTRWLESDRRQSKVQQERNDAGADPQEHGEPHSASSGSGGGNPSPLPAVVSPEQEPMSDAAERVSHKRTISGARDPGHGTEKKLKTNFQRNKKVCEINLWVGPKDVHYQKKGSSGCWVVNQKVKRGAEVCFRDLTVEEQIEFQHAKKNEINSFVERSAVEIASKTGVPVERIMGMRWILVWKNQTDDEGRTGHRSQG
jgi:hypothetical protein